MKPRQHLFFFVLLATMYCGQTRLSAQDPTPASSDIRVGTVYLTQDYLSAMKETALFTGNEFEASFQRFDNEFAVFRLRNSKESVFIPKSAILYMRTHERTLVY